MDRWLITFFIGGILSLFMPIVPELFYVNLFTLIGGVCLSSKKLRFLSGLFFGAAWILYSGLQYNQIWQKNKIDPQRFFNHSHLVQGTVKTIPSQTIVAPLDSNKIKNNYTYKFNFTVFKINQQILKVPLVIRLSWNKTDHLIYQGSELALKVKLKPPHGLSNQGGFNYKAWLRQNNIVATGYVINNKTNLLIKNVKTIRQRLYFDALALLPEHQLSPLLMALSFGERAMIQQDTWDILNKTNTQHLIAISGLHLGLIATGSFLLITLIVRMLPFRYLLEKSSVAKSSYFLLGQNSKYIAVFLSCSLTLYYAYLAGFSLPTLRALIMLLLFWCFKLWEIKCRLTTWICLTLFIVMIFTPMSLISGSFWLSFYAVILILLTVWRFQSVFSGPNKWLNWLKSLFWIQLSLSVFMLPIVMMFNYQLSFISIFANLIAVPLMSFSSIPLCLLAVLCMPFSENVTSLLYQIASMSIDVLWRWLVFLADQPWAVTNVSFEYMILLSLTVSFIGLACFLSLQKRYMSSLFLVISFFFIYHVMFNKQYNNWLVTVLDVGQGLSIVIEKNNNAILYDTGASYPSGFNMVEASVLPYLKHRGIDKLDKVIISHSDNDHAGGLDILKNKMLIDEVIANDITLKGNKPCKQGDNFIWHNLDFTVLWPLDTPKYKGDENDDSCVISISDGVNRVLLTGDISKSVEKLLLQDPSISPLLQSNVIIAPHHGSNTSSSERFIETVTPTYVVYSTGFMNRWKMPSNLVQDRYAKANVVAFNTAKEGMIKISLQAERLLNNTHHTNEIIKVTSYNQGLYPFWFAN